MAVVPKNAFGHLRLLHDRHLARRRAARRRLGPHDPHRPELQQQRRRRYRVRLPPPRRHQPLKREDRPQPHATRHASSPPKSKAAPMIVAISAMAVPFR